MTTAFPQQVESEVALEYKKFDIDEDEGKVGDEDAHLDDPLVQWGLVAV